MHITVQLRSDRRGPVEHAWLHFTGVTFTMDEKEMLSEDQEIQLLEILGDTLAGIVLTGPLVPLMRR